MVNLDIIIINWNSGLQLRDCMESITVADKNGFELSQVIIVDNASTDDSVNCLVDINLPLKIIRNTENKGFAVACNQGAQESNADYLLFLNPDTSLFKDSLLKPLMFMEKDNNQNIGIVGIQLVDDKGNVSHTCTRFPTPAMFFIKMLGLDRTSLSFFRSYFMTEWDHGQNREVDHVIGAFYFIRRFLYNSLSGFDERFFVYMEDLDFSYRAWQKGWKSFYLSEARAFHKGGGTSEQVKDKRLFYSLRSRILYANKHFTWHSAMTLTIGTLLLEPLIRICLCIIKGNYLCYTETMKGVALLWQAIPSLMFNHRR